MKKKTAKDLKLGDSIYLVTDEFRVISKPVFSLNGPVYNIGVRNVIVNKDEDSNGYRFEESKSHDSTGRAFLEKPDAVYKAIKVAEQRMRMNDRENEKILKTLKQNEES